MLKRKWESRNKPDDEIIPLPDDPSQAPDEVVGVDSEGRPTREVKPTVTTTDDLDAENVPEIKISSNVDAQIEAAEAEANRIAETGEAEVTTEAPTEPEAPAESTREEIEDEWKKLQQRSFFYISIKLYVTVAIADDNASQFLLQHLQ